MLLWYHLLRIHVTHLPKLFKVASLDLRQSYACPSDSEATLKDKCEINWYQILYIKQKKI